MELWRTIRGFPSYQVSSLGRVKSLERDYKYGKHGDIILKQNNRRGYKGVTLFKDGKRYYKAVHRLVAEAFIDNPNNLPMVNHKDENRTNNKVDNLEYCDAKYNINYGSCRDKISKGVSKKVEQLTKDGLVIGIFNSMTEASNKTGVYLSEISKCCKDARYSAGGYKWRRVNG